eukprot:SAG31_NODE_17178_length_680_cov_1.135972_1_plen_56_part_00
MYITRIGEKNLTCADLTQGVKKMLPEGRSYPMNHLTGYVLNLDLVRAVLLIRNGS